MKTIGLAVTAQLCVLLLFGCSKDTDNIPASLDSLAVQVVGSHLRKAGYKVTTLQCLKTIKDGEEFDGAIVMFLNAEDEIVTLAIVLIASGKSALTDEDFKEVSEAYDRLRKTSFEGLRESGVEFNEWGAAHAINRQYYYSSGKIGQHAFKTLSPDDQTGGETIIFTTSDGLKDVIIGPRRDVGEKVDVLDMAKELSDLYDKERKAE